MAEVATPRKWKKTTKAQKEFKEFMSNLEYDQWGKWYLDQGIAGTTTEYNQLADVMFFQKFNLHLCILDIGFNTKNYSTAYTHLQKYDPTFVGFYPGVYTVTEVIDEDGNTAQKKITDVEQLQNARNIKKGGKFYFAGLKYKLAAVDLKHETDDTWGWALFGECKDESEAIYVRKTIDGYIIINWAMPAHKTRQLYGSGASVYNMLSNFVKTVLLNEDNPFMNEVDGAEDPLW